MANSELTKRVLADGIKKVMETKAFDKITVTDITDSCGVSRNTFYYHFQDKYELVNWIFYTEITPIAEAATGEYGWAKALTRLFCYLQDNRAFYTNVLRFQGQNSFVSCLLDFYQSALGEIIEKNAVQNLTPEERQFAAKFYSYALIGIVTDWVTQDMRTDPEAAVTTIKKLINGRVPCQPS